MEIEYKPRQRYDAGKQREIRNYPRTRLAVLPEVPDTGVSKTRRHSAEKSHYRREQVGVRKRRLYNEQSPDKCTRDSQDVKQLQLFFEEYERKDNTEKRRHLVKDRCVRKHYPVNSVEVRHNAERPAKSPHEQHIAVLFCLASEAYLFLFHYSQSKEQRNEISEKYLLHRRKIARHSYKRKHERKAECRKDYQQYRLVTLFHSFRPHSSFCAPLQARPQGRQAPSSDCKPCRQPSAG